MVPNLSCCRYISRPSLFSGRKLHSSMSRNITLVSMMLPLMLWLSGILGIPGATQVRQFAGCDTPPSFTTFSTDAIKTLVLSASKNPDARIIILVVSSVQKYPEIQNQIQGALSGATTSYNIIHATYEQIQNNPASIGQAAVVVADGQYVGSLSPGVRQNLIQNMSGVPQHTLKQFIC